MAIDTLVKTVYSDTFRDEVWEDLNAGKLMSSEFKQHVKYGDEVDCQFHDTVTLGDYTGVDLDPDTAEIASTTTVKVKIDKGKSVIFRLDEQKIRQIESAKTNDEKVKLIREYSNDTREQFLRAIDKACCGEVVRAGHIITNNGSAITATKNNMLDIFQAAKIALKEGDNKGHTAWFDGEMIAVINSHLEGFLSTQNLLQYSDVMAKNYKKGYKGELLGFNIVVDDNLFKDNDGYVYPLFGRSKKTIAGGIQDDFEIESAKKVGGFNTYYWGRGVFGVKAPLSYLLCTAKLNANFTAA